MDVETRFVLRDDVEIVPVGDLDRETRARFTSDNDDFVLSRSRGRSGSTLVDSQGASFLQQFAASRTVIEAVILYSLPRGLEPEAILREVLPLVNRMMRRSILVEADSLSADSSATTSLEPGETIANQTHEVVVVRLIQKLDDGEVYQVQAAGHFAALKIDSTSKPTSAVGSLEHEAAVLAELAADRRTARVAPRLLGSGEHDGRAYLLLEWCRGVAATVAAAEWRAWPEPECDRGLLDLCRGIARAYAQLHELGFLHGDVHPRNLIVDRTGDVRLIDFGLAREAKAPVEVVPVGGRPGVAFYLEPEVARAVLAGQPPPSASAAGEQFAVAVLLYQLVTGVHYCDFGLERKELHRQIAEESPMAFADRGRAQWPALESVLGRALAKDPADRYPSMAEMAQALDAVSTPATATSSRQVDHLAGGLSRFLDQAALDGPWLADGWPSHPLASVNLGAAGIAFALYRIACQRDDAALLALADVWACRAETALTDPDAIYPDSRELDASQIGTISPHHTASGIHMTQAFVAGARNDGTTFLRALTSFVAASDEPSNKLDDLTLGRAGTLLGCALLDDLRLAMHLPVSEALEDLARRTMGDLWKRLDERPPLSESVGDYLGIAHGWAGYAYATLQWCRASGNEPPATLEPRLAELAAFAVPKDRGAQWPRHHADRSPGPHPMSGWCHGSAGYVFLWSSAHRMLGSSLYEKLTHDAAWNAWEARDRNPTLCCGLAGRAYALLCHGRATGDTVWFKRARTLGQRAAREDRFEADNRHTLYKGEVALAVLAADLERPEYSAMPFFEAETDVVGPHQSVGTS